MKKSLIAMAALAAVAFSAMSGAAFAASPAKPAVIDTGQVLNPATKAVEVKPTRIIAMNSTSAVAKAMALEMQLVGVTKTGSRANVTIPTPWVTVKMNTRELTPSVS